MLHEAVLLLRVEHSVNSVGGTHSPRRLTDKVKSREVRPARLLSHPVS